MIQKHRRQAAVLLGLHCISEVSCHIKKHRGVSATARRGEHGGNAFSLFPQLYYSCVLFYTWQCLNCGLQFCNY